MQSSRRVNKVQAILDLPSLRFPSPMGTGGSPRLQQLIPLAWVLTFTRMDFGARPGFCTPGMRYLHDTPAVAGHCGIDVLPL